MTEEQKLSEIQKIIDNSAEPETIELLEIALKIDFYSVLKLSKIVDIEMKLRYYET